MKNPLIFYNTHGDFQQTNTISSLIGTGTGGVTESLNNRVIMPVAPSLAQTDHTLVHELVHLGERGHGPRFQRLMDEVLPDWRERRAALNERPPRRFPGDAAG